MKILFTSDDNGWMHQDLWACLVETKTQLTSELISKNEVGNRFTGGQHDRTLVALGVEWKEVSRGKKSDYTETDYDLEYKLFSGNY